jgi:hypothetical protein
MNFEVNLIYVSHQVFVKPKIERLRTPAISKWQNVGRNNTMSDEKTLQLLIILILIIVIRRKVILSKLKY